MREGEAQKMDDLAVERAIFLRGLRLEGGVHLGRHTDVEGHARRAVFVHVPSLARGSYAVVDCD